MVMGDFKADLSMDSHGIVSQLFGHKLLAYCQTETLTISDYELMDVHNTYTHVSTSHKTTSWLDHIISTSSFHDLIEKISVDYTLISSDHLPMSVILNLDCARVATKEQPSGCGKGTIKWDKLSAADKNKYEELSDVNMSAIKLKLSSVMCDDPHCKDSFHIAAIDGMYNDVLSALQSAGQEFAQTFNKKNSPSHIPGWNTFCKELHLVAREAFVQWRMSGSPKSGQTFTVMNTTRAQFKRALRNCRAEKDKNASDALATKLIMKDSKIFWKEVQKMSSANIKVKATTVGGATGDIQICDMWRDHFSSLLNSTKDTSKKNSVLNRLSQLDDASVPCFNTADVSQAIHKLKKGKAVGCDGLTSEHFIYASMKVAVLLSLFLTV